MANDPKITHEKVLQDLWSNLREGANKGGHPFHTPVLSSVSGGMPDARIVVLRDADEARRQLICHTDARSPKVAMLKANPQVAWLFYDREAKVQLRIHGRVTLHHADDVAKERWDKSTPSSRQCYYTPAAPGIELAGEPIDGIAETDGFANFTVIQCTVTSIDWLYLRARGHLRARFTWHETGFKGQWIAP